VYMRFIHSIRTAGIAIWLIGWVLAATGADTLAVSGVTDIPYDFGGKPLPHWTGDVLAQLDDTVETAPVLRAFGKDGKSVLNLLITIPEVKFIQVIDYARGFDGSLAISGTGYSADSRAAAFLAWISSDGQQQKVARTSPYVPYVVAVAADGTIWTAGWEIMNGVLVNPNHDMIRHFDTSGRLLGSFIPASSLKVYENRLHPVERSRLVVSHDRIGGYSELSHVYIEFSPDGSVINRYPTATLEVNKKVSGVGLCDDGGLFVSAISHGRPKQPWQVLTLDKVTGNWHAVMPVDISARSSSFGVVFGCEGSALVTTTRRSSELTWFTLASSH
jgi:hypothetical protein